MATFQILHASDLHIANRPRKVGLSDVLFAGFYDLPRLARASSHNIDLLEGLARLVYHKRNEIDAVILSGDLATTGKKSDLDEAFPFVDDPPTPPNHWLTGTKPTLRGAGCDIFLIPGNHDRFNGMWCVPGGKEFNNIFRKYWHPSESVQILGALSKSSSTLALIGIDLTLEHKSHTRSIFGKWGQGKVYRKPLAELERCTKQIQSANSDTGVVWVVHFPPEFPEGEQLLELIDDHKFIVAARANQISLILAGHTHNPKKYAILPATGSNDIEVLCAGTATQHISPIGHVVHILYIEVDSGGQISTSRQDLWWNEDDLNFV